MQNRKRYSFLRFMVVAFTVLCSLATSCPDPLPFNPDREPVSEERLLFESFTETGLYINGKAVVEYKQSTFQKAWRADSTMFRIQRDDQKVFLNVEQTSPDSDLFNVTYKTERNDQTLLIVNVVYIDKRDGKRRLWNEARHIGVIMD